MYRQAQHHLTEGQHHFERSENIIAACTTNERGCACGANDVLCNDVTACTVNDVMLRIKGVALRANGELNFYTISPNVFRRQTVIFSEQAVGTNN